MRIPKIERGGICIPVTKVHKTYCKQCPSKFGPGDPESDDIKALPDGIRQQYVFPCAWRDEKLCKGVCEDLGYEEEKHKDLVIKSRQEGAVV